MRLNQQVNRSANGWDLKWHGHEPAPEARSLEAFFHAVDHDEYGCFFG